MTASTRGEAKTEISNALVALHRKHYGRGPEQARTTMEGDLVTCVLEGVLTSSEENMVRGGGERNVADSRAFLQRHDADEFIAVIEEATGRRVKNFISGINPSDGGTATEVFVLEPAGSENGAD
jgi:uncharacterized protein YbcI